MNVKELITHLQTCDPDANVLVYCYEDFAPAKNIVLKEQNVGSNKLYCKGCTFDEYEKFVKPLHNYVVISDF